MQKEKNHYNEYVRTGDLGFIDENGYLVLEGRLNEMINVGGKSIPLEIEEMIFKFDSNIICACVG